jgi:hypothetical protein
LDTDNIDTGQDSSDSDGDNTPVDQSGEDSDSSDQPTEPENTCPPTAEPDEDVNLVTIKIALYAESGCENYELIPGAMEYNIIAPQSTNMALPNTIISKRGCDFTYEAGATFAGNDDAPTAYRRYVGEFTCKNEKIPAEFIMVDGKIYDLVEIEASLS